MTLLISPIRPVAYLVVALTVVGFGIDAGSVVLTRLTVPEHVREAGQAGADAIGAGPANRQAAQRALAATKAVARPHGMKIRSKSFTIYQDGHVELSGSQTAPTLLLGRIAPLEHFTLVKASASVTALPYS